VENGMKINPGKSKAVSFMTVQVKVPLNYSLLDQVILEASKCKYLGIILYRDLSWTDHINYKTKKACKALHFTMRPIIQHGDACWDLFREGQINVFRLGVQESGKICKSYQQIKLGNVGTVQKDRMNMSSLQSVLQRTDLEDYR
jgi:hypothetical protein